MIRQSYYWNLSCNFSDLCNTVRARCALILRRRQSGIMHAQPHYNLHKHKARSLTSIQITHWLVGHNTSALCGGIFLEDPNDIHVCSRHLSYQTFSRVSTTLHPSRMAMYEVSVCAYVRRHWEKIVKSEVALVTCKGESAHKYDA